ncbi:hypothetical protein M0Q28_01600 [Patescibacteria group bacterium]|jgi:hypothetical protein|nr:hypothetical protein [Patescibacteria group bacterium]
MNKNALYGLGAIVILTFGGYWFFFKPKEYIVRSISSHYEHLNDNSETTLIVYESGDSGNVKQVLCLFPPDFHLDNNVTSNAKPPGTTLTWKEIEASVKPFTGIKKVRVLKEARQYMFGEVGYYCEKVD